MLVRISLGSSEPQIAIFEGESPAAVIERVKANSVLLTGLSWVPNPYDPSGLSQMIFDPSLHETPEQAADDENTTYLFAAEVVLGEFWDPDLE